MAIIKPFRAVRPTRDKVHLVASRSYISYNKKQLERKLSENPYTFIHIINPEFGQKSYTPPHSLARYQKVRRKYDEFVGREIFQTEENKSMYIYRQITSHNVFTGIIACASVDDYLNDVIKKHEYTLAEREETFKDYLDVCNFNAEPVLISYEDNETVQSILGRYMQARPEYDFSTTDRVRHQLWVLDSPEHIRIVEDEFRKQDALYIADGHHRCASSALLAQERRKSRPDPREGHNFFMAYFIPASQLEILPFHRLVRLDHEISDSELFQLLEPYYTIDTIREDNLPDAPHQVVMVRKNKGYLLTLKSFNGHSNEPLENLSPELLSRHILDPVFGVKDLRTDNRIHFIGGRVTLSEIKAEMNKGGWNMAFLLSPVTIDQLKEIANRGLSMPPKSTWIEPKLRSGLTIYEF